MRPYITDNITEVFHASNHLFSKPDINKITQNSVNHINGLMGLCFSTTNEEWFDGYTLEQMILKHTIDLQVTKEDSPISVGWTEVRNGCIESTFDEYIQLYTKYKKEKNEKNK